MLCIYHLLLIFVKLLLKLVDWNRSGKIIALSHFTVQTFQFIYHFPCLNTLCNGFQSQRLGKPNRKLQNVTLCLSCQNSLPENAYPASAHRPGFPSAYSGKNTLIRNHPFPL